MPAPRPSDPSTTPLRERWARMRGDVVGGVVSATVAIPLAIGYGMFAFVGLGDAYFAHGVLAGLYTAIIVAVVNVAMGERGTAVYAPRVITTFFLGAIILNGLLQSDAPIIATADVDTMLAIVFSIVLLAGLFQALFGVLKVGTLMKHTPYPVMAGFQNAAALLLMLAQAGTVLGYPLHVPLAQIVPNLGEARPLSIVVALSAGLATWHAKRFAGRVPPVIVGLAAGTITYYVLSVAGLHGQLGPTIGSTPTVALGPQNLPAFAGLFTNPAVVEILPAMFWSALSLAAVASLDALLCARLLQPAGAPRGDDDRRLVRLGAGNMAAACFGGITSGFNLGPSLANRAFGARTHVSVLVNAAITLATLLLLLPAVAWLPRAALSGVIVVIAIQHFDPWSVQLARRLAGRDVLDWRRAGVDLGAAVLIALLAIVVDIVVAVAVGLLVSVAFFVSRLGRSAVRRLYGADSVRSRRLRDPGLMYLLAQGGHEVLVLELEGALFFGTAESLVSRVEAELARPTTCVILDVSRVTEIDSTGASILLALDARLARAGITLQLCGLGGRSTLGRALLDMGVIDALTPARIFTDPDRALEWAEDRILARSGGEGVGAELPVARLPLLARLSPPERSTVERMLVRRTYRDGEVVVREGAPGTELFLIARGSATARIRIPDGREMRLLSFSAGSMFGEVGLLDQEDRSATVQADGDLVCYVLTRTDFVAIQRMYPGIAITLLANLARELSTRLRRANQTIQQVQG